MILSIGAALFLWDNKKCRFLKRHFDNFLFPDLVPDVAVSGYAN